mgnify:CR=1 FL=1
MRITSGILIFLISINLFAEVLSFSINRFFIRKEAKEIIESGIPEDNIEKIIIDKNNPPASFKFIKDHEFMHKGSIYDIVRTEKQNQKTIYYCINDTKEKFLISKLLENKPDKQNISSTININILKSLTLNYLITSKEGLVFPVSILSLNIKPQSFYKNFIPDILPPPPKL